MSRILAAYILVAHEYADEIEGAITALHQLVPRAGNRKRVRADVSRDTAQRKLRHFVRFMDDIIYELIADNKGLDDLLTEKQAEIDKLKKEG